MDRVKEKWVEEWKSQDEKKGWRENIELYREMEC